MDITIRRATAGDAKGIAKLFDDYRVFFGEPSDLPLAQNFIADLLHHTESVIFFAQTPEERCVGFAQLYPSFSSVSAGRVWILNDLFVTESARGMGIGTKLLGEIKAFGSDSNAKSILVETTSSNTGAQKLYETTGYQEVSDRIFYEQVISDNKD